MCVKATWLDVHSNGGQWALLVSLGLPAVACCNFLEPSLARTQEMSVGIGHG